MASNEVSEMEDEFLELNIRPEVGMYSAFARLNYKPWYALAEYVDNSLQSHIQRKQELIDLHGKWPDLVINIEIDTDSILIEDNAGGISAKDLPRALRPARPPPDNSGLSEFGLGMKAASSWFAHSWSLRTTSIGESIERTISMNIERIVGEGITSIKPTTRAVLAEEHYTVLTLSPLRRSWDGGRTLGKIRSHLESMYRRFFDPEDPNLPRLRLSLRYPSGDLNQLQYKAPSIVCMPKLPHEMYWAPGVLENEPHLQWRNEVNIELDSGRSVRGWVGLLTEMRSSLGGFAVFRRGRLIVGGHDQGWRTTETHGEPGSYAYKSIVGELDVFGFDVSHTKDGIAWGDEEEEIIARLRDIVRDVDMNLYSQTNLWRRKEKKSTAAQPSISPADTLKSVGAEFKRKAPGAISSAMEGGVGPAGNESTADGFTATDVSDVDDPTQEVHEYTELFPVEYDNQVWKIRMRVCPMSNPHRWYHYCSPVPEEGLDHALEVSVNSQHAFSETWMTESPESYLVLLRFVALLALAEHLSIEKPPMPHPSPANVRMYLNKLLTHFGED